MRATTQSVKPTRQRKPIQRVLFFIATLSYLTAVICAAAAFYQPTGLDNPIAAALMASVVFFVGVGIVLHVIADTDLPNLKIGR